MHDRQHAGINTSLIVPPCHSVAAHGMFTHVANWVKTLLSTDAQPFTQKNTQTTPALHQTSAVLYSHAKLPHAKCHMSGNMPQKTAVLTCPLGLTVRAALRISTHPPD
jgi:hypothetical protein